jgi:hypothetical protein
MGIVRWECGSRLQDEMRSSVSTEVGSQISEAQKPCKSQTGFRGAFQARLPDPVTAHTFRKEEFVTPKNFQLWMPSVRFEERRTRLARLSFLLGVGVEELKPEDFVGYLCHGFEGLDFQVIFSAVNSSV